MTDLPAILSGMAIVLAALACIATRRLAELQQRMKDTDRSIDRMLSERTAWVTRVNEMQDGMNTATSKSAETIQRIVTDVQHLKQDLAKVQNLNTIPQNSFPGVPTRRP